MLVAMVCVFLAAPAHAQVRRNEQQRPGSMTIEEYEPRSMLVTRETAVRRAKFPFVDIHGHQDLTMSDADLASLVKQMDAMNMRVMNNLSGGWGEKLAAQVRNVRAKYPGRLTVFANVDWSRVNEPNFAQNAAAQLEQYPSRARPSSKYPPFDSLIAEQHRMFKRHPRTQFISAHLSWLGQDLQRLSRTLDTIPNMNVEVAAALYEIGRQPRAGRDFFIKYQDRILMGKDTFGGQDEFAVYFRIFETTDEYFP